MMPQRLILTFAELEFALRAQPEQATQVRDWLGINPSADNDIVVAAGIASMLARGLATMQPDGAGGYDVVPGEELAGVTLVLSTTYAHTEAVGWLPDRPVVLHLFSSPSLRLILSPGAYGQFDAEFGDADEPLSAVLGRFLDVCLPAGRDAAVAVRSRTGGDGVQAAIFREASGQWRMSDTLADPDSSQPVTREAITVRLEQIFGGQPIATR